jgi:xylulose-5-phosphate/fructose-6-phosphate phosphoketolase
MTATRTTDMLVVNDMDPVHLVMDVIDRVPGLGRKAAVLRQQMVDKRAEHRACVRRTGEDLPEIHDWTWTRTP